MQARAARRDEILEGDIAWALSLLSPLSLSLSLSLLFSLSLPRSVSLPLSDCLSLGFGITWMYQTPDAEPQTLMQARAARQDGMLEERC